MRGRWLPIACRFAEGLGAPCPSPAVAYVTLSDGCACFPNDRRQYLCLQHLQEAEPIGSISAVDL